MPFLFIQLGVNIIHYFNVKPYNVFTVRGCDIVVAVTFDAINQGSRKLAESDKGLNTRKLIYPDPMYRKQTFIN